MMMMMNCFCGMVDWRKAFSPTSSRDDCQRSSPSRVSYTQQAGVEPAQNLSSGLVEWSCAVATTTTPRLSIDYIFTILDYLLTNTFHMLKHYSFQIFFFIGKTQGLNCCETANIIKIFDFLLTITITTCFNKHEKLKSSGPDQYVTEPEQFWLCWK